MNRDGFCVHQIGICSLAQTLEKAQMTDDCQEYWRNNAYSSDNRQLLRRNDHVFRQEPDNKTWHSHQQIDETHEPSVGLLVFCVYKFQRYFLNPKQGAEYAAAHPKQAEKKENDHGVLPLTSDLSGRFPVAL